MLLSARPQGGSSPLSRSRCPCGHSVNKPVTQSPVPRLLVLGWGASPEGSMG